MTDDRSIISVKPWTVGGESQPSDHFGTIGTVYLDRGPRNFAKVEIHGDNRHEIAQRICDFLNGTTDTRIAELEATLQMARDVIRYYFDNGLLDPGSLVTIPFGDQTVTVVDEALKAALPKPKITDHPDNTITVTVGGEIKQKWVYSFETHAEKMRQAHYFCDGYLCAQGASLKQVGMSTETGD